MSTQGSIPEKILNDAWVYLVGRAVVIRQEQQDIARSGVTYNQIKYNATGKPLEWVNPNLDVANNEAWFAVDASTPAILEIPEIKGRYYTAQILDEWGEVITNINPRNYPLQPFGRYVLVLEGSQPAIPEGAVRIDLRSPKGKMLARVELANDVEGAVALQRAFRLRSMGRPVIAPPPPLPDFDNRTLIGMELFDHAEAMLASAPDVSPAAGQLQAQVRAVAAAARDPARRAEMEGLLRAKIIPAFQKFAVEAAGVTGNNWMGSTVIGNYGEDYAIRSAANYIGIWANARHEVIYFVTTRDGEGRALDGSATYVLDFPADGLPDAVVNAYWSLSLVDVPGFLAVQNAIDRYSFNSAAPPPKSADGSLKIFIAPAAGPKVPEGSWLPAPAGKPFSLTFRTYVPKDVVKQGKWFPPPVRRL